MNCSQRRDRGPGQAEEHLLAAVGVAQHERGVERERDAGEIEHDEHERRQQPPAPVEEDERVEAEAAGADVVRGSCHVAVRWYAPAGEGGPSRRAAAAGGGGRLGPMGRWREAATDALATFAASRLLVLAVLLVPPTRVHSYLTTWDAGFYLDIARCGYDPACAPAVVGRSCPPSSRCSRSPRAPPGPSGSRRPGAARCSRRSRASRR